jgi:nucleoside-triphosphatase
LAKRLAELEPARFYTEEIRNERGVREGFRLVTFCGRQQILSHIRHLGPYRVGRYGVDVAGFQRLLAQLDLERTESQLIVIDEIGKMECISRLIRDTVTALLDLPNLLVATIALKGEGFIEEVKRRPDCRLMTVTRENRDRLSDELVSELLKRPREYTD